MDGLSKADSDQEVLGLIIGGGLGVLGMINLLIGIIARGIEVGRLRAPRQF